ncbi:MAG: ZIP family metal transporter, partial [Spirochaetaceae bacterium]|nr:ZIP family metal transporter [Spirochaetaceae bacterium]
MSNWFSQLSPVMQTIFATLFTWGMTALGSATVFLFRSANRRVMDTMLGFSAGVMIAASFWSLLEPSIEAAAAMGLVKWMPAAIGFLAGGFFLRLVDRFLPHLHIDPEETEGVKTGWSRTVLLALAITLHNIPEGLSVGVGFGAAALKAGGANVAGAIVLALGIGLQNFPEGAAVSLPLRRQGMSRFKSFFYGQLSGFVEPVAAIIGVLLVGSIQPLMPYALA